MNIQRATLFFCLWMLCVDMCLCQTDCSGLECPVLQNCIETALEDGACCPKCTRRGCTCEGYQHYDCIRAGFQNGKVPEGESYFVDFGSTECSCPRGGGSINCRFIPCPEIPPNCIEISRPADGCMQCARIGCTYDNNKYEAGHSFQVGHCRVCHCPNDGGRLMCSPIPGCELRSFKKPMWATTTENNSPLRDNSGGPDSQQVNLEEEFSKLALENTLPLYKPDPSTEDSRVEPTYSSIKNLAQAFEFTTVPPTYPESSSLAIISGDDRRSELTESQNAPDPVRNRKEKVNQSVDPPPTGPYGKASSSLTSTDTQRETMENNGLLQGVEERTMGHHGNGHKVMQQTVKDTAYSPRASTGLQRRAPFKLKEDGEEPQRQPQTLYNYQSQDMKEVTEVSAKELVTTCCETGQKWASVNGHCNNMELPTTDRHSVCWTAQQQCCLGSLRESRCLAGITAARAGNVCGEDDSSKCGIDSYKECCGCCFLGLQFHKEGHHCEAHQYLGFHCQHIFLTCCEGGERRENTVRERPALDSTPPPRKVSDGLYPKEAFSIGEAQDGENAVEGPVEVEDMDECLIYEGNICHHRCINTPGSFRCECFPGYVLQEDAFTCAQELVDEGNILKEDGGEATSPFPPAVLLNPCEGSSICEQQCTPVDGRPMCSCSPGFSLRNDGRSCEDINECLSAHACQFNERCMNTEGSFVCQRLITCPPGFQINNDICEDTNECEQGSHNCGVGFDCVNTEGSFRCRPKPQCPVGFNQDAQGSCADIDECGALTQPCGPGYNCVNTAGSYMCNRRIICSRGYHASPDGSRCVDVNECEGSLHQCGEGQLCQNLPGSYRCECQTGYQYDSFRRMCVDVNECWRYPGRLCAQICENTLGSYQCSCTSGFRLSSDGKNCEDVNECLASPCSQECANIYGSYQCYCRKGYHLREDGHTCEDIDECSQTIGHLCTYKCVNVPGSYECACPEFGYTMSPNGRSCRDIDECGTGAHNCSLAETCYNIQGGYRCLSLSCPPNYRKFSNTRCERISCPNHLECQNSPLRIDYYYLSFQSNIVIPAQIFRIGPSPAYSGDNVIVTITEGNEDSYFSTRKLNAYTGAVYLQRQVEGPRDFLITVEMKLWRQGSFTTFQAKIYVFITPSSL
ncbi:fibulin-2-like [Menidia menidia]